MHPPKEADLVDFSSDDGESPTWVQEDGEAGPTTLWSHSYGPIIGEGGSRERRGAQNLAVPEGQGEGEGDTERYGSLDEMLAQLPPALGDDGYLLHDGAVGGFPLSLSPTGPNGEALGGTPSTSVYRPLPDSDDDDDDDNDDDFFVEQPPALPQPPLPAPLAACAQGNYVSIDRSGVLNAPPLTATLCAHDEVEPATVVCDECEAALCEECARVLHRAPRMRDHHLRPC